MSRFRRGRLGFYDASITLSLRRQPEGGELATDVQVNVIKDCAGTINNLYVLVHGFNNHEGEARLAYQGFRDRQTEQLLPARYKRLGNELRDTFWPGDAEWVQPADYVDFLVYPKAVGTAREAGVILARYLLSLEPPKTVNFIGHSLGCRVVLETILNIQQARRGNLLGKVCLMAAAVPVFMLSAGGRLEQAGMAPEKIFNLTSKSDRVLQFAFPPGQTAASPTREGFFPKALGRHGIIHPRITNRPVRKANHGDYWGHGGSNGSDARQRGVLANSYVAELFGWDKSKTRKIDERQTACERQTRTYVGKSRHKRVAAHPRVLRARKIG